MSRVRIIPRIDIKNENLVKGIHFEGLRVLGAPEEFANYYYENGADEIMYTDVVASLYDRCSLNHVIEEMAKNIFVPLTVAGGIRNLDDIRKALLSGADKVSLNTAAIENPSFIKEAAREFGRSTIVVTVESIKGADDYYCFTDNGREETGRKVLEWVKEIEELGAGEIVLSSVDHEGAGKGFDLELIKEVVKNAKVPVVVHGGAGTKEHVESVVKLGVDGVVIASLFHYDYIQKSKYRDSKGLEGNTDFLKSGRVAKSFEPINIKDLKGYLNRNEKICREI